MCLTCYLRWQYRTRAHGYCPIPPPPPGSPPFKGEIPAPPPRRPVARDPSRLAVAGAVPPPRRRTHVDEFRDLLEARYQRIHILEEKHLKLSDLEPRWFGAEGTRFGLTFLCPHCRATRLGVAFHHAGKAAMEDLFILAHHGADDTQHIWDLAGQEDFATLTLSPSIDASKSGHWHGFIRAGQIC
jgi:hypothetical protein